MSTELEAYQKLVSVKASQSSSDILANAGPEHAAIAMAKLLEFTEHYVKMVVGSFNGAISNQPNYIKSLNHCLSKGVKFEIIFLEEPNFDSEAFKILLSSKDTGHNIVFKKADEGFMNNLTVDGQAKHFSVYDDDKFRFEKDTVNYLAFFSFNDSAKNAQLKKIFDSKFNFLEELKLNFA